MVRCFTCDNLLAKIETGAVQINPLQSPFYTTLKQPLDNTFAKQQQEKQK